jgi:hypothetical protein
MPPHWSHGAAHDSSVGAGVGRGVGLGRGATPPSSFDDEGRHWQ